MKTFLLAIIIGITTCAATGCIIPAYSGDRIQRGQELLFTSEDLRAAKNTWARVWFLDQPCHLKPYRTHGGII